MNQASARFNAAKDAPLPTAGLQKKIETFLQASADNHFALGQHYNKDTQQIMQTYESESDINDLSLDSTPRSGNHTAGESTPRTSVDLQSVDLQELQGKMNLLEEGDAPFDDAASELLDYDDFPSPPPVSVARVETRTEVAKDETHGLGLSVPRRHHTPVVPKRGDSRPSPSQPAKMSNEGSQFGMHNGASQDDLFRSSPHILEDDYDYNSSDEEEQVLAAGDGNSHEHMLSHTASTASLSRRSADRGPPRGVADSHLPPTPPSSTQDSVLNTRKSGVTRTSTAPSTPSTGSPLRQRAVEDKSKHYPAASLSSELYKTVEKRSDASARSSTTQMERKRSTTTERSDDLTKNKVEVDSQYSMQKLLTEDIFMKILSDTQGRHQFRAFLEKEGSEGLLDFYCDMTEYQSQYEGRRQITEAVYESYASENADVKLKLELPMEMSDDLYSSLRHALEVKAAFSPMREHVRQSLYKDQFQRFIKSMLIDQYRNKLGSLDSEENYTGLSDCFCLTNPRAGTENPIVLASEGFLDVTGYSRQEVLGRNCRFLQGPATSPDSVDRIRDALNGGKGCMELLLNYRKDGTPFFCLLSIIPLRDARGQLAYFIGGQCNVSDTLASGKTLEYFMGKNVDKAAKVHTHAASGTDVSPTLARYFASQHLRGNSNMPDNRSISSRGTRDSDARGGKARKAAGAYDPTKLRGPCGAPLLAGSLADGSNAGSNGLLARITGRSAKGTQDLPDLRPRQMPVSSAAPVPRQLTGQRLLGAEDTLRQAPASTLKDQLWLFHNLYSRIIIFKRHKREVIFVTAPLLEALGLPCATDADRYDSGLLHCDVLSLLQGNTKNETRVLRQAVQDAIHSGKPISVMTGLRRRPAKTGVSKLLADPASESASDRVIKFTALHVTPLYDRDDATFAFVAVLG